MREEERRRRERQRQESRTKNRLKREGYPDTPAARRQLAFLEAVKRYNQQRESSKHS